MTSGQSPILTYQLVFVALSGFAISAISLTWTTLASLSALGPRFSLCEMRKLDVILEAFTAPKVCVSGLGGVFLHLKTEES